MSGSGGGASSTSGAGGGSGDPPPGAAHAPLPTGPTTAVHPGDDVQAAITSAAPGTTLVFAPGTYPVTNTITLKSGVSLYGRPGAILQAQYGSMMNGLVGAGVSDVTISGFIFDGGPNGGGGIGGTPDGNPIQLNGFVFIHMNSNNVRVIWNDFRNNTHQADMFVYNSDEIHFQKNVAENDYSCFEGHHTDNLLHAGFYITDNVLKDFHFMAVNSLFAVQGEFHVDRNQLSNPTASIINHGNVGLSVVGDSPGHNAVEHATIWGNTIEAPDWTGIEVGVQNTTVSNNTLDVHTGFFLASEANSVVENNTITVFTSDLAFFPDGGYDMTEWVGTNLVTGVSQTGWPGHGPYGTKPATYPPSTPP
jgi:hypothetical protein